MILLVHICETLMILGYLALWLNQSFVYQYFIDLLHYLYSRLECSLVVIHMDILMP